MINCLENVYTALIYTPKNKYLPVHQDDQLKTPMVSHLFSATSHNDQSDIRTC